MSVLNDLRRRAETVPPPAEVTLTWNHLGSLVEHIWALSHGAGSTRAEIRSAVIRGEAKVADVPIRLIGVPYDVRQAEIDAIEKGQR